MKMDSLASDALERSYGEDLAQAPEGVSLVESAVLSRLIEEVRNSPPEITAYNRTYNRHNKT